MTESLLIILKGFNICLIKVPVNITDISHPPDLTLNGSVKSFLRGNLRNDIRLNFKGGWKEEKTLMKWK